MVPRLAASGRNPILRILLKPYDVLVAPFGDAFAWATIISKVQGSDEIGKITLSAGAFPAALEPGWPPLFDSLSTKMKCSADERAGVSAGRLRDALAAMAKESSGQTALAEIAKVVGWDEIIHTSYFNVPELGYMIASWIQNRTLPTFVPVDFKRLKTPGDNKRRQRQKSFALPAAFASFAAAASIALSLGCDIAYQSGVEPLTSWYQLEQIAERLKQRRIVAAANGAVIGNLVARLYSLNALLVDLTTTNFKNDISNRLYGVVKDTLDEDQRFHALQRVFFHLGYAKRHDDILRLLQDATAAFGYNSKKVEAILAISAELGYAKSGATSPSDLANIAEEITRVPDQSGKPQIAATLTFPFLVRHGRFQEADTLAGQLLTQVTTDPRQCHSMVRSIVREWTRSGQLNRALALVQECEDPPDDRYARMLEMVSELMSSGGEKNEKKAYDILLAIELKVGLFDELRGWSFDGIADLLAARGRVADAKAWLFRRIDLAKGFQSNWPRGVAIIFDTLKVADELVLRGDAAAAYDIKQHCIESVKTRNAEQADTIANRIEAKRIETGLALRVASVTKDTVRAEAQAALNDAETSVTRFQVAGDAAMAAMLYSVVGDVVETRQALEIAVSTLPKLQPANERPGVVREIGRIIEYMDASLAEKFSNMAASIADDQSSVNDRDEVLRDAPRGLARNKSLHAAKIAADRMITAERLLAIYSEIIDTTLSESVRHEFGFDLADDELPKTSNLSEDLPDANDQ